MKLHSIEKMLIIILVICGLVSMIGYSFAYFVSGVNFSGTGSNSTVDTANLIKVQYDAGTSAFNLAEAYPGKSASKNFSVTVMPTGDANTVSYAIKLVIDTNSFVMCDDSTYDASTNACIKGVQELVYTLKDSGDLVLATGDLTGKTGDVLLYTDTKTTSEEAIYNYSLEISFKDTGEDQNHNVNQALTGSLKVEFAK